MEILQNIMIVGCFALIIFVWVMRIKNCINGVGEEFDPSDISLL